jgi:hypothetical protein
LWPFLGIIFPTAVGSSVYNFLLKQLVINKLLFPGSILHNLLFSLYFRSLRFNSLAVLILPFPDKILVNPKLVPDDF